jgi:hypothetical protein
LTRQPRLATAQQKTERPGQGHSVEKGSFNRHDRNRTLPRSQGFRGSGRR